MKNEKALEPGMRETLTPVAYIRKVGRGKTLSSDLDIDEAREAFTQLLNGRFTEAQAGAFLQALRIKELTQGELDGLMEAMAVGAQSFAPLLPSPSVKLVINLASDTPRKGGYASLLAARLLSARGIPTGVVRSDPMLSGNTESWDGTWDLIRNGPMAGVTEGSPLPSAMDVYDLIPALRSLRKIRSELGFRSCLHTAEKLVNPWPEKPLVLGISHRHYAERLAANMQRRGMTGKIVLGNHGTPDLILHKETEIWEVLPGGEIRMIHVHPGDLGLQPDSGVYSLGFFPKWGEELAREGFGILGPVLSYHMAFLRYAAGEVPGLREGLVSSSQASGVA